MRDRWAETPFAALTPCLIVGILAADWIRSYCFAGLAIGLAFLLSAALIALARQRRGVAGALGLAALFQGGALLALAQRDALPPYDLRSILARQGLPLDRPAPFDGCVDAPPIRRLEEIVLTVRLRALRNGDFWEPAQGKVWLRIPDEGGPIPLARPAGLRMGDSLRGWAAFRPPRNFLNPGAVDHRAYLARRGIYLEGRVKSSLLLEVIPGGCAGAVDRLPASIRKKLSEAFARLAERGAPDRAALLASIVLGDYSALGASVRETFQNSGTYHVLVVSGLHIGWIAWTMLALCRRLRIPLEYSRFVVAASVLLYGGVVGFQASVSRALWMFLLYLTGQMLFRRAAPANISLAAGFFLLVLDPSSLLDVGFQLSFLAVLGICLTAAPLIQSRLDPMLRPLQCAGMSERLFFERGRIHGWGRRLRTLCELGVEALADRIRWPAESSLLACVRFAATAAAALAGMVVVSLSVQLWLEPLLAFHFNRLSWVAVVANLVLVPLSSLVLAAGALAALGGLLWSGFEELLRPAGWLAYLLVRAAGWFAGWPLAWQRCPTPPLIWVVAGIAMAFLWSFMEWKRGWLPWLGTGFILASLACGRPLLPGAAPVRAFPLLITFLDVGDGDAVVFEFKDGHAWVLDAGGIRDPRHEQDRTFDIGEAVVSRYLWSRWIKELDVVWISHPDIDHAGGIPALLRNFRVGEVRHASNIGDPMLERILAAAAGARIPVMRVGAGDEFHRQGMVLRVIHPGPASGFQSTNDNSLILHVRLGNFSALMMGDAERPVERVLAGEGAALSSRLLKVAHHGSRSGTSEEFVRCVEPAWSVISTGRYNPFGHPSPEVTARLLRAGSRLLLTSDLGAVSIETDGRDCRLKSHVSGALEY